MPATLSLTTCRICQHEKAQHELSICSDLCRECFDQAYGLCADCGRVLQVRGWPNYPGIFSVTRMDGDTLCDRCAGHRRDLPTSCWRPTPCDIPVATYERIGSRRKYGVEVETAVCDNYTELRGRTLFGAKEDCSVSGMEFDSPVLYGDEGLAIIDKLLAFADENGWFANCNCGCHIHLDMRDETDMQVGAVGYAYRVSLSMWQQFVPDHRRNRSYSHAPRWSAADFRDNWEGDIVAIIEEVTRDRYECVNLYAYLDHNTVEVRMLEGTCNVETIHNWIICHARFVDAVKDLTFDELDALFSGTYAEQFTALAHLIGPGEHIEWLRMRWQLNAAATFEWPYGEDA